MKSQPRHGRGRRTASRAHSGTRELGREGRAALLPARRPRPPRRDGRSHDCRARSRPLRAPLGPKRKDGEVAAAVAGEVGVGAKSSRGAGGEPATAGSSPGSAGPGCGVPSGRDTLGAGPALRAWPGRAGGGVSGRCVAGDALGPRRPPRPPRGGVAGPISPGAAPAAAAVAGEQTVTGAAWPAPVPATARSRPRSGCERRSRGHYCAASSAGVLVAAFGGRRVPLPSSRRGWQAPTTRGPSDLGLRGGGGLGGSPLPVSRAEASPRAWGQIAPGVDGPCILSFAGVSLAATLSPFPAGGPPPRSVSGSCLPPASSHVNPALHLPSGFDDD